MKSGMLSNADGVLENKRRRQKWKRLAGVLGCLVVIGTTYVLMRPAETLERELICGMEEHKHSVEQGCYRQVAAEAAPPICGWEEGETGHVHSDECYSEESVLTCTEPESETHRHEDSCYTTEHIQTCGLMEMKNHAHTGDCYLPADEDTETEWELICELLEHTHNEECYANDAVRHIRTEEVTALIDALPSPEEVEARMAELLAAEDTEGYDAYCAELARQVERAGAAYETLTDEQKVQLNTDRLTALYIYLPAKEETFTLSAPATESGIVVTIFGKTTSIPCPVEELTLTATEVEDESANALRDQALEDEELTAAQNYMLDIKLMRGEEEVQPTGPITVTFMGLALDGGADVTLADDGTADDLSDRDAEPVAYQTRKLAAQTFAANVGSKQYITDSMADDATDIGGESYVTKPKVYQIDENIQRATEVDAAVNNENNVVLETYRLANLYSVSLLAATGNVTDAAALKAACEAGGTVVLGADITTSNTITIASGKNTTIDLNGYKIAFTKTTKNANLFYVNGGSLIIEDSKANADGTSKKETKSKRSSIMYAESRKSLASVTSNRLTYYVVESSETDAARHLTAETQWTRAVSLGGGQAGAIVGSGTSDGQVAIYQTSGTVTMKAGYICDFGNADRPGAEGISASADYNTYYSAVTIQGGTFNLEGGVLAANRSYSHGGAIYMYGKDCKLVMTGGIISGNYVDRVGGGLYCSSSSKSSGGPSITLSNGYITCNSANGYFDGKVRIGGGGLYLGYRTYLTMTGGYVTGNYSKLEGGGIEATIEEYEAPSNGAKMNISNGYISSNRCLKGQGAGICINYNSKCTLKSENGGKTYITNNSMQADNMFGGGGIYVGHRSNLYLYNTLISENTAKHIGGGYGSCFVSNTFVFVDSSVAIFDNYDGGANGKPRNSDAAKDITNYNYTGPAGNPDPYPISKAANGHQDVYMGGNTRIYSAMLGGGDPKWSGSRDGSRITLNKADQYCTAKTVIGLTAHPSDADKNNARNAANVYITGNYAARYGGGIMSNGTVYFGYRPPEETLPTRLVLVGKKSFLKPDGKAASITEGRFKVTVTNTKNAADAYTGTVDAAGNLTFPTILFKEPGTYTYKIKETVYSSENITYDTTSYTMTVTVKARQLIKSSLGGSTVEYCFPTTVKIVNDKTGLEVFSSNNVHMESTVILRSAKSGGVAFTNRLKGEEYTLNITKKDRVTGKTLPGATFEMNFWTMDPRPVGEGNAGTGKEMYIGVYCVPISAGVYRYVGYSWNIPSSVSGHVRAFETDNSGNLKIIGLPAGEFQLREKTAPDGYLIADEWKNWNNITLSADAVPSGTYAVTVADPPITYTFQFLKVSAADQTTPVPNAKYQLLDSTGAAIKFVMNGTEYRYSASGTINELVTDNDGRFQILELPRGSYTLHEIEVPAGFGLAEDYTFTLPPETAENRVLVYTQEEPVVYELPETGGAGAKIFVIPGAVLLAGAASLLLYRDKRRKARGRTDSHMT